MKKKMLFCIVIFLLIQLAKVALVDTYMQCYGASRLELVLRKNGMLQYKQIQNNEVYLEKHPVLMNQIKDVSCDWNEIVDVIGTNSYIDQLERLVMVDGAFFGEDALIENRNVVVISDQLSISLCGTEKASGNMVHIEGKVYEIVGVYKKYRGLGDQYANDDHEKVYVPLTSSAVNGQAISHVIFDGTFLEAMPTTDEIGKMGINQVQMTRRDHTHWIAKIKSLAQVPMLGLVMALLWIGGCKSRKIYQGIYTQMKDKSNAAKYWIIGKTVIFVLCYLGMILVIFKVASGDIYISEASLPAENIFDLTFYWKRIKSEWAAYNQMSASALQAFERIVYLVKLQIHSMNIVQYILLVIFSVTIGKVDSNKFFIK